MSPILSVKSIVILGKVIIRVILSIVVVSFQLRLSGFLRSVHTHVQNRRGVRFQPEMFCLFVAGMLRTVKSLA